MIGKLVLCSNRIGWSTEYDSLPLRVRQTLLHSRKQTSDSVTRYRSIVEDGKEEDNVHLSSELGLFLVNKMTPGQDYKQIYLDADISSPSSSGLCYISDGNGSNEGIDMTTSFSSSEFPCNERSLGSDLAVSTLQHPALSSIPVEANNARDDDGSTLPLICSISSSSACMQGAKAENKTPNDFVGDLEHIVLRERRQMLLSRLFAKSQNPCIEAHSVEKPTSYLLSREAVQQSVLTITTDRNGIQLDAGNLHTGNIEHGILCTVNTFKSEITGTSGTINQSSALQGDNLYDAEPGESKLSTFYDAHEILRNKASPSIKVKVEPFLSDVYDDRAKVVMKNVPGSVAPVEKELGVEFSPARLCNFSGLRDVNDQKKTVSSTDKLGINLSEPVDLPILELDDSKAAFFMKEKLSDGHENIINSTRAVCSLPSALCVQLNTVLSSEIGNKEKTNQDNDLCPNVLPMQTEDTFTMDLGNDVSESVGSIHVSHQEKLGNDLSIGAKISILESNDTGASCSMENKPSDRQEKGTASLKAVSSLPPSICVKLETALNSEIHNGVKTYWEKSPSPDMVPTKTEVPFSVETFEDELDHMSLLDRLKLLSRETSPRSEVSENSSYTVRNASSNLGLGNGKSKSVGIGSVVVTRSRKRRRTATNNVETALEEDVPGLLKVLIEKGVLVEEIKLYGEPESDEAIDEAISEDSFAELEAVIQKVFSYRESFSKATPLCCSKGSKVTYYLGCLVSLIEQACLLRSKKWPVEWGWCRDLYAFIFVFQRQNRIVLERPEYGYATYFFELLEALPVKWQIRRLVTTMKLTNCGRISLLENRPLKVGDDLSEGEARVLSQYGWIPNAGLATMLNYCGRVVHDTSKERDGNEWRLKIARMLVNGYNGGSVVPKFFSEKPMEKVSSTSPQVKSEM